MTNSQQQICTSTDITYTNDTYVHEIDYRHMTITPARCDLPAVCTVHVGSRTGSGESQVVLLECFQSASDLNTAQQFTNIQSVIRMLTIWDLLTKCDINTVKPLLLHLLIFNSNDIYHNYINL